MMAERFSGQQPVYLLVTKTNKNKAFCQPDSSAQLLTGRAQSLVHARKSPFHLFHQLEEKSGVY